MIRVLIVDDSAFMRKAISRAISSDPAFEVVGVACNGRDAVEKSLSLRPDVITLDLEMPVMDGLTAMRTINETCQAFNPRVLVCTSPAFGAPTETPYAECIGASDVIIKAPCIGQGNSGFSAELLFKLHAISPAATDRSAEGTTCTRT